MCYVVKKIQYFSQTAVFVFFLDWKQYGVGACSAEFQLIAHLFLFSFCPVQQRIALFLQIVVSFSLLKL